MTWKILLAAAILVVAWSLSRSMPVVLGGWVGKLAGRTATRLDDHLVEQLDEASGRTVLASGLWLAWEALAVPGGFGTLITCLLLIGVVLTGAFLFYDALVATFEFLADPHDDKAREMMPAFEGRFRRCAGALSVLAAGGLILGILGLDGALAGALVITGGLAGVLGFQPAIREFWAGLDLIRMAGWRPGMRVHLEGDEGELVAILPSGVTLETGEGRANVANTRAIASGVITRFEEGA